MNAKISTDNLRKTAEEMSEVMTRHNAMATSTEIFWNELERRNFVESIIREAEDEDRWSYFEMTYSYTQTRLIITFGFKEEAMVDGESVREAFIRDIIAVDHPGINPNVNYEALTRDLSEVAGILV